MAHVVDTCGWIEWLTDGVLADKYAPYLESLEDVYVPTSVQFELYKWVKRESSEEQALEVIALTEQGIVTALDTAISLAAADFSTRHKLSFADAIIYATAQQMSVSLITSDDHFEGLPDVEYFSKKSGQL
jgi:predicted nucleic acid-binding protein